MIVGIVGLGLIGGSIARDLKKLGHTIIGVDEKHSHIETAKEVGFIDSSGTLENAVQSADIVFLAVPVNSIEKLAIEALDMAKWNSVIIDVGSTKNSLCELIKGHGKRGRFVAAHPLAGTEFSGPKAAIEGLFKGKKNIICEEELVDEDALDLAVELFNQMAMHTLFMDPAEHDKHMAYVSHLSHVSSFMLGMTVLDIEKDVRHIANLASTGFESTVRLAKSSPETWTPIFMNNSEHLTKALGAYIDHLIDFKARLDQVDENGVKEYLISANRIKRVLKGMKLNILKLS